MRSKLRPIANDLSWIVLPSAVPAAWVAAALAASCYEPSETNALLLLTGVMALLAGVSISILMTRELRHALDDLAAEADMLSHERPLALLKPTVREFAAIADGLAAAATRMQQARARRGVADALRRQAEAALELAHAAGERGQWRWDLQTGAMAWSAAANLLFHAAPDGVPSRAQLLALTHPSSRAALVAWLGHLARGEDDVAPLEFSIVRGDGAIRTIRATATAERDASGAALAIAGSFVDVEAGGRDVALLQPAEDAPAGDMNALLQTLAASMRERAREAGIDFGAAIMPELGPPRDQAQMASALAFLGESVLTVIPRGGRILLRAATDGGRGLTIAFGCHRPAASDGMAIAGHMVELNCGTLAAKRMEQARALVASAGGSLSVEHTTQGEAVTIALPGASAARKAA